VYYAEYGTTTEVMACDFCNRKNLPGTVGLLVCSVDGEPMVTAARCPAA
jgi:hypothetical protein